MTEESVDDLLQTLGGVTAVDTSEVENNLWSEVRREALLLVRRYSVFQVQIWAPFWWYEEIGCSRCGSLTLVSSAGRGGNRHCVQRCCSSVFFVQYAPGSKREPEHIEGMWTSKDAINNLMSPFESYLYLQMSPDKRRYRGAFELSLVKLLRWRPH